MTATTAPRPGPSAAATAGGGAGRPLLSVEDLVVEYPVTGGVFRAVDGVSFAVGAGRTVAIVGESGCGKSTIARSVVRLLTPTSGRIVVDGEDIAGLSERRLRPRRSRVQMVFQDPYGSLDPHQTASEIVGEPLRVRGERSAKVRAAEAASLLERVGLPATARDRRPAEFSGGQRQRIGIARALASRPDLLVCDEATSALDVSVQAQVLTLLADIQRETGLTYVIISHNLGVVREISHEVVVMSAGRVVEHGTTSQVLERPVDPYTRALRAAALDPMTMTGRKPRWVLSPVLRPAPAPGSDAVAGADDGPVPDVPLGTGPGSAPSAVLPATSTTTAGGPL